jgi:ATP-dependent Lhr-like helicase
MGCGTGWPKKSRWLGRDQFLSYRLCQALREILADDLEEPNWSRRTTAHIGGLREAFPWVRTDSTALVRHPDGELRWWTFAGGVANTILGHHLKRYGEAEPDSVSIKIDANASIDDLRGQIQSLEPDRLTPLPDSKIIENLKFSETLPRELAEEVFRARFN